MTNLSLMKFLFPDVIFNFTVSNSYLNVSEYKLAPGRIVHSNNNLTSLRHIQQCCKYCMETPTLGTNYKGLETTAGNHKIWRDG